jgi:hypothetical protein
MAEKLDPEAKRLRKITPGELADAIGALEARVEVLKAEAIRRELHRAEGQAYHLTPPGTSQRTDKPRLLMVLGITATEYTARFCHPVRSPHRCRGRLKHHRAAALAENGGSRFPGEAR